jgi:hypothetical protein
MDEMVGFVQACPQTVKRIVLALPEDVEFSYIPEGLGMIRTAYLQFRPTVRDDEIRFLNREETIELRLNLV